MRGTQPVVGHAAPIELVSEGIVTLIVVAMLTGITIVLSGAAELATSILSAMISYSN